MNNRRPYCCSNTSRRIVRRLIVPRCHPSLSLLSTVLVLLSVAGVQRQAFSQEGFQDPTVDAISIWPDFAPGESTKKRGKVTPPEKDGWKLTRIENTTLPTMTVIQPESPNGTAVVVLPGGGFRFTVPDVEGSMAARFLTNLSVTVFVLNYRVTGDTSNNAWKKPAQDSQRAIRWIRANAEQYKLNPKKIGLLAFSAGGQSGTAHLAAKEAFYESVDEIDKQSSAPDFGMLIYPWRIEDENGRLKPMLRVNENTAPTFIVSTHDDKGAVSTGAAKLYIDLKENNVDAELHIYRSGGHGYGAGRRKDSVIHKWPSVATDWLQLHGFVAKPKITIKMKRKPNNRTEGER